MLDTVAIRAPIQTAKIASITSLGRRTVVNLNVAKNHTFITRAGIPTHNCDGITPTAQKMLRADLETYSDITRFLATANYVAKIIPALISRFQVINFQTLAADDFIVRAGEVLLRENVEFDIEVLELYVKATYPDLRKCINLLQQNTLAGKLGAPGQGDEGVRDYLLSSVDLFKRGKLIEARKLIISQAQPEEYPDFYRFLYRNLDLFGKTQDEQDDALLVIRKAVVHHTMVADQEINLAACLVELTRIANASGV